jgi:DNA-binding XRE family transcriptional regulator
MWSRFPLWAQNHIGLLMFPCVKSYLLLSNLVALYEERLSQLAIHRQLTLCRRIRALREYNKFTQAEIAERLGVSQAAYSRLEKGEIEISIMKLIALSEIYDIRLQELVKGI